MRTVAKPARAGILLRGLAKGLGVALLTSATLFIVGIFLSLMGNAGWIHLGEDQPWMPIIGLEYGFVVGLLIGAVVCWRFWRSRLPKTS